MLLIYDRLVASTRPTESTSFGNGRIVGGSSRERCADPVEGGGLSWTGKNMLVATVAKGSGAG